jgi:hypothetical protein
LAIVGAEVPLRLRYGSRKLIFQYEKIDFINISLFMPHVRAFAAVPGTKRATILFCR